MAARTECSLSAELILSLRKPLRAGEELIERGELLTSSSLNLMLKFSSLSSLLLMLLLLLFFLLVTLMLFIWSHHRWNILGSLPYILIVWLPLLEWWENEWYDLINDIKVDRMFPDRSLMKNFITPLLNAVTILDGFLERKKKNTEAVLRFDYLSQAQVNISIPSIWNLLDKVLPFNSVISYL